MHDDCVRAIEQHVVDDTWPSRRQRRKVLAVDRHGDDAGVLVVTRGKRHGSSETVHLLRYEHGSWQCRGGAGGGSDEPGPPDRGEVPARSVAVSVSSIEHRRWWRRSVGAVVLRAGTDVASLRWRDRAHTVSPTGHALVVWRARRMPTVTAYDATGVLLDEVRDRDVRSPFSRMPWRARVRYAVERRRRSGEWFNYSPRR